MRIIQQITTVDLGAMVAHKYIKAEITTANKNTVGEHRTTAIVHGNDCQDVWILNDSLKRPTLLLNAAAVTRMERHMVFCMPRLTICTAAAYWMCERTASAGMR
jgi:hypothetical protein